MHLKRHPSTSAWGLDARTHVVASDVQHRQPDDSTACRDRAGGDGVHNGGKKLGKAAEEHADDQEDATAADVGDDGAVNQDRDDADGGEDACVLEAVADVGHLEEISAVRCEISVAEASEV